MRLAASAETLNRPGGQEDSVGEAGCGALRSSLLMSVSLGPSPFPMASALCPAIIKKNSEGIAVWCVFPALAG